MIFNETINLQTAGHGDTLDITSQVTSFLAKSGLKNGLVTVFVSGSTAGITTIEYEPNLVEDFKEAWEDIAPENEVYHHDSTWGDNNGYAHVRASMLGPSLVIPFSNSQLALGVWQQIVWWILTTVPENAG
jgi:secondary thiamine-phosphate synthase enzyme